MSGGGGGGGGSGSGGGDDAGEDAGGGCSVSAAESQCNQCAGTDCCASLETCAQSTSCQNLLSCVGSCATQSCQAACEQQFNGAASTTYQALLRCITSKCAVCGELGVGDPCSVSGATCNAGLTCGGLWCTRSCTKASDCTGLGANGGNFTGNAGACRHVTSGDFCFPGCAGDNDCADFPGTYCVQTTAIDGSSVSVCAAGPDGGLE